MLSAAFATSKKKRTLTANPWVGGIAMDVLFRRVHEIFKELETGDGAPSSNSP
jgi:hypothetical protein